MNKHGVTLLELLIVVVVLGVVASFGVVAVGNVVENTAVKVDQQNAEILEDVIKTAAVDGTIIIQNNRLYNTSSNRAYSGTGSWFFEDMKGYIDNRVRPQSEVAKNSYNKDGDSKYKFLFGVKNGDIQIFYYDDTKTKVVLTTFRID